MNEPLSSLLSLLHALPSEAAVEKELERRRALNRRRSLIAFAAENIVYGRGVNWQPYEYLKYIALQIQTAIEQGNKFIIINLPPRHGKSTLISKALPAWFLSEHPEKFVIATSYSATQAANYGKAAMHLYQKNKGLDESVGLDTGGDYKAKQTAVEWETERGRLFF